MRFNILNVEKEQESILVKIWARRDELDIINYYNPCNRLNPDTLNTAGGQTQGKVVWCGDFNAHNANKQGNGDSHLF